MNKLNVHDQVASNIIKYLDSLNIECEDNKIKSYAKYLSNITGLKYKRLETILSIGVKRRITLMEVMIITDSLKTTPSVILDGIGKRS